MRLAPINRNYFSDEPHKELRWRILYWALALVLLAALVGWWDLLRTGAVVQALEPYRVSATGSIFEAINFVGNEEFYMIAIGLIFWCINKSLAFWASAILLFTASVSDSVRESTGLPRPDIEDQLDGYTFTSTAACTSVVFWGFLSSRIKRLKLWILAPIIIVLVSLSDVLLGIHYTGDVLGGLLLGIIVLALFLWFMHLLVKKGWSEQVSLGLRLLLAFVLPVGLIFLFTWEGAPKLMGLLAGAAVGYVLEGRLVSMDPRAKWYQQIIKFVIGAAVLFGIVMGLADFFPFDVPVLLFIHFALAGIWVTFLAPALFRFTGLSPVENNET